jgi:hypothetical protein
LLKAATILFSNDKFFDFDQARYFDAIIAFVVKKSKQPYKIVSCDEIGQLTD